MLPRKQAGCGVPLQFRRVPAGIGLDQAGGERVLHAPPETLDGASALLDRARLPSVSLYRPSPFHALPRLAGMSTPPCLSSSPVLQRHFVSAQSTAKRPL